MYDKLNLILAYFSPAISFLLIGGLLLFQIFKKRLLSSKTFKIIISLFAIFLILWALILSFLNYSVWKQDPIAYKLLPPFTSIAYFLHYSWQHYFATSIVTIIFAIIVFWGIKSLNKKFNNTFFYDEEPYLVALGILVTSWPNCLIYLSLVLFLGVISHLFYAISLLLRRKVRLERMIQGRDNNVNSIKGEVLEAPPLQMSASRTFRLSLLYFWLPCALLVLFLSGIISKYIGINQFII